MDASESRDRRLLAAGMSLVSELSLRGVLQRIIEVAAELAGARYGALGVIGKDGTISDFVTTGLTQEERDAIGALPVGKGILGALIREATPLRIARIADDERSVGFPKHHPPMTSFLGAPVRNRGVVFGNIYLTEKQGAAEFTAEDEEALTILASHAAVAIENARVYEESVLRERRLAALRDIGNLILTGKETVEVLRVIARSARDLADADLATIATPLDAARLVIEVADGLDAQSFVGTAFSRDGSVSGEVIRTGRAVVLKDASVDSRSAQPIVANGKIGPAMLLPLTARGEAFGTLVVANRRHGRRFAESDLAMVEGLATQASVALEYGRAKEELTRLRLLEDRERIAKELHDGSIQSLFAVGMGLQAAGMLSGDDEVRRRIESSVDEIDRVIRDLRHYIFGLRPGLLTESGLEGALRNLGHDLEEKGGVTTVIDVQEAAVARVANVAGDLIQLTREALSNVGRHAKASTCRVSLRAEGSHIILTVEDDGVGFDPRAAAEAGQGLGNLLSRAERLGGELHIDSMPGEGTAVRIVLPG